MANSIAAPDTGRIKRNVEKMISLGAPEAEIDSYLGTEGFTPQSFRQSMLEAKQPERSMGVRAGRMAEFGARGFMDSAAETVGALPDLVAAGMRGVGLPAPERGFYANAIKSGMDTAGRVISAPVNAALNAAGVNMGPQNRETSGENFAYGAGRGVADAASIALPAGVVARMATPGSVTAGAAQALAQQPVMQAVSGAIGGGVGEATDSPMLGAAAAMATPLAASAARRVVSPVAMSLTPEEARRAALATQAGIELTPGQMTGSRPLQAMESSLAQLPFSASRQNAIYDAQRTGFNRAALARAGVNADRVSPDVIDGAFRNLGQRFDDIAARIGQVNIDQQFGQDVARTAQEYGRRLPTDVSPVFQSYMDDIAPMIRAAAQGQNPQVDGRTFQNISSNIATAARRARARPELADALTGLRDALDDAMERSAQMGANPGTPRIAGAGGQANNIADELRETRRQYRNLLAIDEAAGAGTQADRAAGNLSFGAMRSAIDRQDPRGFARGRGDMADIAQIGDFLAQKIPNSGTPERMAAMRVAQGGMGAGGMFGGGMMMGADPMTAGLMAGGSLAMPPIVQALMNSPAGRAYLTNQVAAGNGPRVNTGLLAALLGGQAKGELLAAPQQPPR